MDIGKQTDNYKYYEGYEDEPEIEFSLPDRKGVILHIWDGFFDDIFNTPPLDGNGWKGFTRDYNQMEGAFSEKGEDIISNIKEYLDDLKTYKNKMFEFKETEDVFKLIESWLENAIEKGYKKIVVKEI